MTHVAKCPSCGFPHAYTVVRFSGGINDEGYWRLSCRSCEAEFVIRLTNPHESFSESYVSERHALPYVGDRSIVATDILVHNLRPDYSAHLFNYDAPPLYVCTESKEPLERHARSAFADDFEAIKDVYRDAVKFALATSQIEYRHLVAQVELPGCKCDKRHVATFYAKFLFTGEIQNELEAYLLAGLSNCDLADRLDGLHSKSDVIALLEKLLIRWHLTSDQIIVAAPFVGHTLS
jgi:hypothetical protein